MSEYNDLNDSELDDLFTRLVPEIDDSDFSKGVMLRVQRVMRVRRLVFATVSVIGLIVCLPLLFEISDLLREHAPVIVSFVTDTKLVNDIGSITGFFTDSDRSRSINAWSDRLKQVPHFQVYLVAMIGICIGLVAPRLIE